MFWQINLSSKEENEVKVTMLDQHSEQEVEVEEDITIFELEVNINERTPVQAPM